jgi:tRNA-dihydrouridine synthase 4
MAVCDSDEEWPSIEIEEHPKSRMNPLSLLNDPNIPYLRICAPMVRYSKLPFRQVARDYNTDICFTPMILSDVFKNSTFSQDIEYQTNSKDEPVIVQFAAANAKDLGDAAQLVAKYSNGVGTDFPLCSH